MTNKQTKRQQRTRAKRKQTERKHRIKTEKTRKKHSPIRHYSPAQHTRLKKLLITALASSPGITPFKPNPLQRGESRVRDIDYDTFKYYGVPKSAYKVGKEYAKKFDRQTNTYKPKEINFVPVVEKHNPGAYSPLKLSPHTMRRTQKRKYK